MKKHNFNAGPSILPRCLLYTSIDGYFKQSVASNATLLFKYVGYKDQKKKITQKGASVDLGAKMCIRDRCMAIPSLRLLGQ